MRKVIVSIAALLLLCSIALGQAPGYQFTRSRLFSGFDGKLCKIGPELATDWNGTILLTHANLLLTGSDVFYGQYMYKSEDNGKTWVKMAPSKSLDDRIEDGCRVRYGAVPHYSRFHKRWYAICSNTKYINDKSPFQQMVDGKPWRSAYFSEIDICNGEILTPKEIPFPFEYAGLTLFGEPVEMDNGDVLMTFYYVTPEQTSKQYKAVSVRYRFSQDGLEVVEAGIPLECPELNRGLCEPSIIRFQGKYYMTIRSDERGMFAVSDDGLHFGPLKTWCWEDGTPIGNKNTQQHWVNLGDRLFLAYTRVNGANNHVFRNRAPIYTAQFDPEQGALVRSTEFALVPELGARLGNFCVICDYEGSAYLITAEWMQPVGCEKYGSDNSLWFVSLSQ